MSAVRLAERIRTRQVSCVEVMTAHLDRIDAVNPAVNAIVALAPRDDLLRQAEERDAELATGQYRGRLHGFPHAVKDLSAAKGFPHTEGSPIHAGRVAEDDDRIVARMRAAGAIIIGKTNTPEFGLGSQSYNPVYGVTRNPYDNTKTAGGSSGGAAAAVALGMVPVADGSDYGGSLRNPAAFCNVYGFRPSLGRIPSDGFAAQLGTQGPMGRTVADVRALLTVLAGPDPGAPTGIDRPFHDDPVTDPATARIAWVGDWNGYLATEPGILDLCEQTLHGFTAEVTPAVPRFDPAALWRAFLDWRALNTLANHDLYADPETRARLKPEHIWEFERAQRLSALDIARAEQVRTAWFATLLDFFADYDFIAAPSAQVFPFDAETPWPHSIHGTPMDTYHRWMETVVPWSLSGLPVLGMPAGFNAAGLPTGLQLIGRPRADNAVLAFADAQPPALHSAITAQ